MFPQPIVATCVLCGPPAPRVPREPCINSRPCWPRVVGVPIVFRAREIPCNSWRAGLSASAALLAFARVACGLAPPRAAGSPRECTEHCYKHASRTRVLRFILITHIARVLTPFAPPLRNSRSVVDAHFPRFSFWAFCAFLEILNAAHILLPALKTAQVAQAKPQRQPTKT